MAFSLSNLFQRYNSLNAEVQYKQRITREKLTEAVEGLKLITDKDVAELEHSFPLIREVRNYTLDDLLKNENGERNKLSRLYSSMTMELDRRLKHFEDNL